MLNNTTLLCVWYGSGYLIALIDDFLFFFISENLLEVSRNPNILEEVSTNIEPLQQQPYELSASKFLNYFNQSSTQAEFYQQPELEQVDLGQPQTQANISSVFSSFSNILKLGGSQKQSEIQDETVSAPAGLDAISYQNPENIVPVPLFSADTLNQTVHSPAKPPISAPLNTYRRSGLKRPVYAPVPGLSAQQTDSGPSFQTPSQSDFNYFQQPPIATAPTLPSHFKPITPQPTTFLIPEPAASVTTAPVSQGVTFPPSNFQSPVMAAIPANELLQTHDIISSSSLSSNFNVEHLPSNAVNT